MNEENVKPGWWHRPEKAFGLAFVFLLVTALLGAFLRYLLAGPPAWAYPHWANYKYFLHAHSHIAFLGWAYNALYALILLYFIPREKQRGLMRLFWFTQIATVGMLLFFPIQGYALESIIFSTLHIIFSWAFAAMAWRRLQGSMLALLYLKTGLVFMIISSFGPFALGPLMVNGLGGSNWYYMAIYYYLHFQYNGWFIFALLALLYQHLAKKGMRLAPADAQKAYWGFAAGCVLSLSLSIIWAEQQVGLYLMAAVAGVLQLLACWWLWRSLKPALEAWAAQPLLARQLLAIAALAFVLKNVLQLAAAWPALAELSFSTRNFIIAFLHLIFLGVLTPVLLAEAFSRGWLVASTYTTIYIWIFLFAFGGSQLLLAGIYLPELGAALGNFYTRGLFVLSALMFLALAMAGASGQKRT